MPAGSPGGGQFAKGSGGGGGGSSAKPDTKLLTGPGGNEATAGSQAKDKKGKVKAKIADFAKDKVTLGSFASDKAKADKFVEEWGAHVGEAPAEFKTEFLGGVDDATMRIDVQADGSWHIHGDIYENGQRIGEYQRNIDWKTKTAESSYFQLNRSATGKDTGKKVLAGNIEKYRQMGLEKVKVHANIDVGGYAWAKYGYVPTLSSWGSLSSEIARKLDRESGGGGSGGGSTYTPESWEELSDSDQEEIKDKWMDATREDFINSEIDSWRESGQALDDAKYSLASNFEGTEGWALDAVSDVIEDWSTDETPIPYTPQQILAAISVEEYQTGYEGRKDPEFSFDDDKLKEPSNAPPKEQMNLPGIEQPDLSQHLTQEMRDDITDKLTEAFNDKAQSDAENMDPPDYLAENVADYQSDYWESMRERDKFQWAEDNGALPEIEIEDEDAEDVEPVEVSDDEADALRKLARSNDPKALWAIADSEKGKELLLGTDWYGTLNLKDRETMDRFNAYVGKPKKAPAA